MFNKEIKERYIKERNAIVIMPSNYLVCQFNKCSFYEEMVQKDICNFTTYEIIDYYKSLNISSVESLVVLNNQFSTYTQWNIQQNLVNDCQNHFLEITNEIIMNCINKIAFEKKIISREIILKWCDELPNAKDAFILLCLFEGIKGKDFCEIFNLKISDFSMNQVSLCTGRKIKVSDKLVELAKESDKALEYYSVSGTQTKKMPLKDLGYIIKGYPNQKLDVSDFQRGRVIYNSCTRSLNFLGVLEYMSANAITESGKIYYIKERSKELNISPREYIYSDKITELEKQYGFKIIKCNFYNKYNECLG